MNEKLIGKRGIFQLGEGLIHVDQPPFIRVKEIQPANADGQILSHTYITIERPAFVEILVTDTAGQIYFIQSARLSALDYITECPAGIIDIGETPMEAAKREVKEEIGSDVRELKYLGCYWPQQDRFREIGSGTNKIPAKPNSGFGFLCLIDENKKDQQLDELEKIIINEPVSLDQAVRMCFSGQLSAIGPQWLVLKYKQLLDNPQLWDLILKAEAEKLVRIS